MASVLTYSTQVGFLVDYSLRLRILLIDKLVMGKTEIEHEKGESLVNGDAIHHQRSTLIDLVQFFSYTASTHQEAPAQVQNCE